MVSEGTTTGEIFQIANGENRLGLGRQCCYAGVKDTSICLRDNAYNWDNNNRVDWSFQIHNGANATKGQSRC